MVFVSRVEDKALENHKRKLEMDKIELQVQIERLEFIKSLSPNGVVHDQVRMVFKDSILNSVRNDWLDTICPVVRNRISGLKWDEMVRIVPHYQGMIDEIQADTPRLSTRCAQGIRKVFSLNSKILEPTD